MRADAINPARIASAITLAATASCALALSACGADERTPEAYCRSFYSKAAPIRQRYVDANKDMKTNPLAGAMTLLSAPGDMESIFDGMIDHAPDDIKSDTTQARDAFKKLQDSMGKAYSDPLGAVGEGLANSLTTAGAFERVDRYLNAHCPMSSPLAQDIIKGKQG